MQKKILSTMLSITALGFMFLTFSANEGCNINIVDSSGSSSSSDTSDQTNAAEDELTITGSGEYLTVGYNTLAWTARINWQSGLYFFSPDPNGTITGNKIICAASIDDNQVEGDCFRTGHVCHFNYWHDSWTSVDNKDVYYLESSSCKEGGEVGPFLVPLDSPLCGDDPFPSCPSDAIFPTGPEDDTVDTGSPADTTTPTGTGTSSDTGTSTGTGDVTDTGNASETQPSL